MTGTNLLTTNTAGESSRIAVATFNSTSIVTALKNGSGNLELIAWDGSASQLTQVATGLAGAIDEVALVMVGNRAVTAVRNRSGNLEVISWGVTVPPDHATRCSGVAAGSGGTGPGTGCGVPAAEAAWEEGAVGDTGLGDAASADPAVGGAGGSAAQVGGCGGCSCELSPSPSMVAPAATSSTAMTAVISHLRWPRCS